MCALFGCWFVHYCHPEEDIPCDSTEKVDVDVQTDDIREGILPVIHSFTQTSPLPSLDVELSPVVPAIIQSSKYPVHPHPQMS